MTRRLWFNVPLCDNCWAAACGPDKHPGKLLADAGRCIKCGSEVEAPVYVRTCFPPHEYVVPGLAENLAALAAACDNVIDRHRPPKVASNAGGPILCTDCGREWPCPDRAAVGTLLPDPSNHMLRHLTGGDSA